MKTVFVVMGEYGEYESHTEFVSGIFAARGEAEAAMASAMVRRKAYEAWSAAVNANWPRLPLGYFKFPLSPEQQAENDAMRAEAEWKAGPKPEYERAESVTLFEMPIGVWQNEWAKELATLAASTVA